MTVDPILPRWRTGESSSRTIELARCRPEVKVTNLSGMEIFEAIFAGNLPPAPIGDTLDFIPIQPRRYSEPRTRTGDRRRRRCRLGGHRPALRALGADKIIARSELSEPAETALGAERWAAAVVTVGSHTLVNVLAQIHYGGTVANCGLAQGLDLPGSVAPVHPARCNARRDRLRQRTRQQPRGGMESSGTSRRRATREDDIHSPPRPGRDGGTTGPLRNYPWTNSSGRQCLRPPKKFIRAADCAVESLPRCAVNPHALTG